VREPENPRHTTARWVRSNRDDQHRVRPILATRHGRFVSDFASTTLHLSIYCNSQSIQIVSARVAKREAEAWNAHCVDMYNWSFEVAKFQTESCVLDNLMVDFQQCSGLLVPSVFGQGRKQVEGGVWSHNQEVTETVLEIGRLENLATGKEIWPNQKVVPNAIFGGYAINHFGHFLTESIGRIPNIPKDLESFPILFISGSRRSKRIQSWQSEILSIAGVNNPVSVVNKPVKVGNLIVPAVSFHQNMRGYGDKQGLGWRDGVFPQDFEPKGDKIYVSRSLLDADLGRFLGEREFEEKLTGYGYKIVHPQNLTIPEQVEVYRQASHIVLAEGSPIHLINLVCTSAQKVAIIQRRPKLHSSIARAARYFSRAFMVGIDAVVEFGGQHGHKSPDYKGVGKVDFDLIFLILSELSFLSDVSDQTCENTADIGSHSNEQLDRILEATTLLSRTRIDL
jgi:Glycosyltransferase 61